MRIDEGVLLHFGADTIVICLNDTQAHMVAGVALANTAVGNDTLTTTEDIQLFIQAHHLPWRAHGNATELKAVRDLRPILGRLFTSDRTTAANMVNSILKKTNALPQLVRHDGLDWHIHATPDRGQLATRIAVGIAMAMSELIRGDDLTRLGICAHDHCERIMIDLAKNRSRRFCSTTCGNRVAVATYRARRAEPVRDPLPVRDDRRGKTS